VAKALKGLVEKGWFASEAEALALATRAEATWFLTGAELRSRSFAAEDPRGYL
jgi:hypothetical protein